LQQITCSLALPLYWPRVNRPLWLNHTIEGHGELMFSEICEAMV